MSDLAFLLVTAAPHPRMKKKGPRALFPMPDGRTLIRHQLDTIERFFPKAEKIVVVGEQAESVIKAVPPHIRIVENENWETTGTARSVLLGTRATAASRVMVIYGDMVFGPDFLGSAKKRTSAIIGGRMPPNYRGVGLTVEGRRVTNVGFGCGQHAWLQAAVLNGQELEVFKKEAAIPLHRTFMFWEVINRMNGNFVHHHHSGVTVELDSLGDYKGLFRGQI